MCVVWAWEARPALGWTGVWRCREGCVVGGLDDAFAGGLACFEDVVGGGVSRIQPVHHAADAFLPIRMPCCLAMR